MLLFAAFVIASVGLGLALSRLAEIREGFTQLAFSIATGFMVSSFIALIISWWLGSLSALSIICSIALLIVGIFFLSNRKFEFNKEKFEFGIDNMAALLLFLFIAFLHFNNVLVTQPDGRLTSPEASWVDYPFHLGIINSFVYGDNFPPYYPIFAKAPLTYPFVMDFLTAVFMVGGAPLREAVIFANLLFFLSLVFGIAGLAKKISNSRTAAAFALILFLLNGNFGIFYAVQDALASGDAAHFIFAPPHPYSHLHLLNFHFMNILTFVFIAQRAGLMGFAISAFYYLIIYGLLDSREDLHSKRRQRPKFILAGVLLGSLVMVYPHAFVAACIVSFLAVLPSFIKSPKSTLEKWFPLLIFAFCIALPQLVWEANALNHNLIEYQYGWMTSNKDASAIDLASFWLQNAWVPLFLAILSLWKFPKYRNFYLPFALIFLIFNLIRIQPQDWDTIKLFLHWFLATCILGGIVLADLWKRSNYFKALAILLLAISTAAAFINLIWWENDDLTLYQKDGFEVAQWIRGNTPPDSIFLTGGSHADVVQFAGRKVVMGFGGQIWTQGINTEKYGISENEIRRLYETGECNLAKQLQADYIFYGPSEGGIKRADFEHLPAYNKVYDMDFGNGKRYQIFKNNC
ncbi:MAG: hypothetical protein V1835_05575 [Candidatus Micrarchaeota archaeon]